MKLWVAGMELGHSKLFISIFLKLQKNMKNKLKGSLQRILQGIMKKKIFRTPYALSMSRFFQPPSDPAYCIEDFGFQ